MDVGQPRVKPDLPIIDFVHGKCLIDYLGLNHRLLERGLFNPVQRRALDAQNQSPSMRHDAARNPLSVHPLAA